MLECTEATQKLLSSFSALHKPRSYAAIIGFSPTKANTTFFLFIPPAQTFCSPLALFQLTHLSEGKTFRGRENTRRRRSTLWIYQTHFNFRRDDEFKHFRAHKFPSFFIFLLNSLCHYPRKNVNMTRLRTRFMLSG